ncbi:phage tail tip lysozyme [Waltera acetigignens]|nr:MAG: N-acetylmuramoyl-L-alanine amidase [Bacteriophage sp.]
MKKINRLISGYNHNPGSISRIKYIVIHYVGALGDAKENCQYYAGGNRNASAHYFVGFDGEIWQSVEDANIAWHCGASSYKHGECRNANSIGIELCVRKRNTASMGATDKDWYFEDATVEAAAELTRYLMDKYNVPASNVIRHYDVTGKICPNPYVYNTTAHTWDEFRKKISGGAAAPTTEKLYRVRKSWEDAASQLGAFEELENAKKACKAGYTVYDWNGKAVYPKTSESKPDTGNVQEKEIWDFFTKKGLNAYAVAGLMGNLFAESGLNPCNLQNTYNNKLGMGDEEYTKAVDAGSYSNFVNDSAGYGLAQWTFYTRKQALFDYAKAAGVSIGNLAMQLAFLWEELHGYKSVMDTLKSATSVRAASDAVLTGYEKPADQSENVKKQRAGYGDGYYKKYAEGAVTPDIKKLYRVRKSWEDAVSQLGAFEELENAKNACKAGYTVYDWNGKAVYSKQATKKVPYKVQIDIDDLRIRTGAGTNYAATGEHTGRGVFTIVEEKAGKGSTAGWGKLKSGAGWVSLDYCTKLV